LKVFRNIWLPQKICDKYAIMRPGLYNISLKLAETHIDFSNLLFSLIN
jgi:hypothetical protein